jgi:hypothetical protein
MEKKTKIGMGAGLALVGVGIYYLIKRHQAPGATLEEPTITTEGFTDLGDTAVKLWGNLNDLGTASYVKVSFIYGTTPDCNEGSSYTKTLTGVYNFGTTVEGLIPNTTYYFKAKAVGDGTSYGDVLSFTTNETTFPEEPPPAKAPVLTSPANGSNQTGISIKFKWGAVSGTTGYHLIIGEGAGMSTRIFDDYVGGLSKTVSGFPDDGRKYYWQVAGYNDAGLGPYSSKWNFTNGTSAPPTESTFTVIPTNIPSHASGAHQYYISYGGKTWGMIDPQADVLTPIDNSLTITGPRVGTIHIYLEAGPWKAWNFYISGTFEDGGTYPLDLSKGIPGAGVALTDLTVNPNYLEQGKTTTISVTAINNEETDMGKEIVFTIGNSEVGRKTISLKPKAEKTVSIKITPTEVGKYTVKANGLSANFEVTEYYPPVSKPEIKEIRWRPTSEWGNVYCAKFRAKLLLPKPSKGQFYAIRGLLSPEGVEELSPYTIATYIGNGLWQIDGVAGMSNSIYCTRQVKMWHVRCSLCSWEHWSREEIERLSYSNINAWAQAVLQWHGEVACYEHRQDHCGYTGAGAITWTSTKDDQFWNPYPCPGTVMDLSLHIALYPPNPEGDPNIQPVKTWKIATAHPRLRIIIDVNNNMVLSQ